MSFRTLFVGFSAVHDSRSGAEAAQTYADVLRDEGAVSSPYNLAPVYGLLVAFNEAVVRIAAARDPSALLGLHKWIDALVSDSFLPYIKQDYKRRLDAATDATDTFRALAPTKTSVGSAASTLASGQTTVATVVARCKGSAAVKQKLQRALEEAPRALMASVAEVYAMLEELHEDVRELSAHAAQHTAECQRIAVLHLLLHHFDLPC